MKSTKFYLPALLLFVFIISSCKTISYTGDVLTATDQIDVFYEKKDVKRAYKIIGRFIANARARDNKTKNDLIKKAKSVGADGLIISGVTFTEEQRASAYVNAEAIKYMN